MIKLDGEMTLYYNYSTNTRALLVGCEEHLSGWGLQNTGRTFLH